MGSNPILPVLFNFYFIPTYAPLAQWIRASGYEPEGRGFESLRAYTKKPSKLDGFFYSFFDFLSLSRDALTLEIGVTHNVLQPCACAKVVKLIVLYFSIYWYIFSGKLFCESDRFSACFAEYRQ